MVLGRMFDEAFRIISDGQEEIKEDKKLFFDDKNYQVSLKIPRKLAVKKDFDKDTVMEVVFNPSPETIERAVESGFIIFPKEVEDGK